ncbi:hypothetical protein F2Q68_00025728 [Brassica cretica]|uniref:Uncharacterized protein n=1 Tax=Brassica cretica TaxID=69181 RepID=A0A8S9IHQ2_BRACR|nr:hypothetical protein F2Q68_00025728 [Brassica cretica]
MSKVLTDWLKLDPCPSQFYYILRTPLAWLNDGVSLLLFVYQLMRRLTAKSSVKSSDKTLGLVLFYMQHMDAFINLLRQRYKDDSQHFRSERLCFLDHVFSRQRSHKYPEFKSDEGDLNGALTVSDLKQGEARRQTKKAMAMKFVRGKRERERKLANPHQSPFKGNSTAKLIIPNKRVGQGYDPFAPFHKKMSKMLTDWVKLDPYYKTPMAKKPRRCPSRFYHIL